MYFNIATRYSIVFISLLFMGCSGKSAFTGGVTDSLRSQALEELKNNLRALPAWEKVHAAEYLLWLGCPDGVRDLFLREEDQHGSESPYRIGIWRVLAQSAEDEAERVKYIDSIRLAYRDRAGADRLHAVETLAKLGIPILQVEREITEEILRGPVNRIFVYALWGASLDSVRYQSEFRKQLIDLVASPAVDEILRLQAAFALRNLRQLTAVDWKVLAATAGADDNESMAHIYLVSAAYFNTPADSLQTETHRKLHHELLRAANSPNKGARMEMAYALGERGDLDDIGVLVDLLNSEDPLNNENQTDRQTVIASKENADVRSSAAFGILRMAGRKGQIERMNQY